MKIKMIDLFNKIANGEETPKRFIYRDYVFHKKYSGDYACIESGHYITEEIAKSLNLTRILNEEVEIIEEDKTIKELQFDSEEKYITTTEGTSNKMRNIDVTLATKINELVREIKKMKEGEK